MYQELSYAYNDTRKQNVSIGIKINDLKIDITPGIKQSKNTNYYSIYKSKSDSWTQTNIALHNQQISESGRTSEIKLLKIWRELHNLEFPSIYLEYLLKNEVLLNKVKSNNNPRYLGENFFYSLTELAKDTCNSLYARVIDPSELINSQAKQKIIQQAKNSINASHWYDIVY